MTLFFRALTDVDLDAATLAPLSGAFYDETKRRHAEPEFNDWLARYGARVRCDWLPPAERRARMHAANPRYVLRNYLAQQVIDRAEQGDDAGIHELLEVLRRPYTDQFGRDQFAQRRPACCVIAAPVSARSTRAISSAHNLIRTACNGTYCPGTGLPSIPRIPIF